MLIVSMEITMTAISERRRARLYWGDGKTKSDVPTDIFSQGRKKPLARGAKSQPQTSHSADVGT